MAASEVKPVRCAVYTRKSTEDGLDQAFNSLDAQREAGEAYVLSQRHEGWALAPGDYDDGGFSGGSMDRPALLRLLDEVGAKRVDVIVVYKIDRLTRSLGDFARIVDVLDGAGASFVSVTQAFNTTTSMGRLTLNVLLSFAQFEREVTGERIRDKIAASKARGMWMGGVVPLGYEVKDRKLVVVEEEAATVRHIFQRYVALGSAMALQAELDLQGIRSKRRVTAAGREYGDAKFSRGALYQLLQNRLYVGEVTHKGASYPGEHAGIVDPALFEAAQTRLQLNRVQRLHGTNAAHPSLLAGIIWDQHGRASFRPHH
jgi:DNA invertase Pin-like site-specific DNA recombinase